MSFLKDSTQKSTIVITGGASGIGLALAARLVKLGHEVVVTGRRAAQLELAKTEVPGLKAIQADLSTENGRIAFHKQVITEYPEVNVLINNAGILSHTSGLKDTAEDDWTKYKSELAINLEAPIHLTTLFLPQLVTKPHALIANVTSILGFFQTVYLPVYCATKVGLHSFTISLRHQLKDTNVQVVEIVPPAVKTALNQTEHAADLDIYADDTIEQLLEGKNVEIGHGEFGVSVLRVDRDTLDAWTEQFATWRP